MPVFIGLLAAMGAVFFLLPLAGLVVRTPWADALAELAAPETLEALRLSLVASFSATALALLMGVPLA